MFAHPSPRRASVTKKRSFCGRKSRPFFVGLTVFSVWLATSFYTSSKLVYQHDKHVRDLPATYLSSQRTHFSSKTTITTTPGGADTLDARRVEQQNPEAEEEPQVQGDPDITDDVFLEEPQESDKDASTKRLLQEPLAKTESDAYFIKRGKNFHVTSRDALDLHDRLPAGTYSIGIDAMSGEYFLQTIDSFEIHGKIYGDTKKQSDRILKTFLDRRGSTGVLLSGEKGSGKTFLAKYIAIQAAHEHQIPTVVVNQPLFGERFNAFIQSIQQPTIFLFDEFEKIYAEKDPRARMEEEMMMGHPGRGKGGGNYNQDSMLTLLDGTYTAKMLFILTTNNKYRVSEHMRNRPGRIYYVIDFAGLPNDFIQEYCHDKLKDKTKIPQVVAVSSLFEAFSFDMLQAMVEEMNRYDETPEQVLDYLNVRPEFATGAQYLVKLIVDGVEIPDRDLHSSKHWFGNPLVGMVAVHYQKPRKRSTGTQPPMMEGERTKLSMEEMIMLEEEHHGRSEELQFTANDIDGMDSTSGTFSYWNEKKKARLILRKDTSGIGKRTFTNGALLQRVSQLGSVGSPPQKD